MTMETMITTEPCNWCGCGTETYVEGMVTEDNKNKKKTNDIITG